MTKYYLILLCALSYTGCNLNKKEKLDDFIIRHDFTIFWYIDYFAKNGISKHSKLTWKDCNINLKHIDVIGIENNRDIYEYIIIERYDSLYFLQTMRSPKRIILKKGNMLYFYEPSSNSIKTNIVIDIEEQKRLYSTIKSVIDIEEPIVNSKSFKENIIKKMLIKPGDTFVITCPKKDSLEFYYTILNNKFIVRWYYERMDYYDSLLMLKDSISVE